MYESEVTQFLKALKDARPDLEEEQRRGRAIWWDRPPLDLQERERLSQARVPQKPYPYAEGR